MELETLTEPVPKNAPVETVETVETVHFTRLSVKPKLAQFHRLPQTVSVDVDYADQDEQSDNDHSPTPKKKMV